MMLTRDQLEKAAKYLCKMRNVNPHSREFIAGNDMGFYCDAWENAAAEITKHEMMAESIRFGKEPT